MDKRDSHGILQAPMIDYVGKFTPVSLDVTIETGVFNLGTLP